MLRAVKLSIFVSVIAGAILLSVSSVSAQCTVLTNYCPGASDQGFDFVSEGRMDLVAVQRGWLNGTTSGERDDILEEAREYCVATDTDVNNLWSYSSGSGFGGCTVPEVASGKVQGAAGLCSRLEESGCCPSNAPNLVWRLSNNGVLCDSVEAYGCCPNGANTIRESGNICYNGSTPLTDSGNAIQAVPTVHGIWQVDENNGIIPAVTAYTCGGEPGDQRSCRIDADGNLLRAITISNQNECLGAGEVCLPHDTQFTAPATGEEYTCVNGRVRRGNVTSGDNDGAAGCDLIDVDSEEADLCFRCIEQNTEDRDDGKVFVWNALGCWDVSLNGVVTRLFQIGVGIIGGVMILRFIQAAIMMQTDNPEQIREAREIITSAIIALIVLLGAVVILRFLGINVLGILPVDFLA